MKPIVALVASVWIALPVATAAQELLLENGRIVDPATREVRVANLLIVDGRIVGFPAEVPSDSGSEVIASTTAAGAFMGREWGIAVGDEANLVILDASPIEDIRNTRKIHAVIHRGEVIDRESLLQTPQS